MSKHLTIAGTGTKFPLRFNFAHAAGVICKGGDMGFFGGPSKGTLLTMSQGIAAVAMQIQMLQQAESSEREAILARMRSEGAPTSMNELVKMAASVVREQGMGWYKKNQFLGMIFGGLVSMGFSMTDANSIKGQIELLS